MKKILITICLALSLALSLTPAALAAEEDAAAELTQVQTEAVEQEAPESEEEQALPEAAEDPFTEAKDFIAAHFAGIVTALAALYAVFPKWGGIAALLRVLQGLSRVMQRFGAYVDDAGNENSIYNVLCRQGEQLSAFMTALAPVLEELRAGVAGLGEGAVEGERLRAVLLALEEGQELMAKEFSDLISISTTVPQKHKAELEDAFLRAREHLRERVREATGNDTAQKEASA